jgi:putative thioredoxin
MHVISVYSWCEPCKRLTPRLEKLARSLGGRVRLAKLNADAFPDVTQRLAVTKLPTVIGLFGNQVIARFEGDIGEAELTAFSDKVVAHLFLLPFVYHLMLVVSIVTSDSW